MRPVWEQATNNSSECILSIVDIKSNKGEARIDYIQTWKASNNIKLQHVFQYSVFLCSFFIWKTLAIVNIAQTKEKYNQIPRNSFTMHKN